MLNSYGKNSLLCNEERTTMNDTTFAIRVYKEYFNFAASHFMIFQNGTREPLHGHNYRVQLKGNALALDGDMVFDFLDIKPIVREICNSLDHKLLLPQLNQNLTIKSCPHYLSNLVITTKNNDIFSIPKSDVLCLPIENTSAERLAIYLAYEIEKVVQNKFNFAFSELEVEVEETRGQSAIYSIKKEK